MLDQCQSLFGFVLATAEHHEVIGISHKAKAVFVKMPVENIQSDVGQQRRNRPTNNLAKSWLTFDIVIPRFRLKPIRGQGPDFDKVQVDKEVTSTQSVGGNVHGRKKPGKEMENSGRS